MPPWRLAGLVLAGPLVIVNLKVYREATGRAAIQLARRLEDAAASSRATVALVPGLAELAPVAAAVGLPVLAQHVDATPPGQGTGHVTAESVREAGAVGSLLNHSERRVPVDHVARAVLRLRENALASVVCAKDVAESAALAAHGPDLVAVEPPELIGGNVSVTSAEPHVVSGAVEAVKRVAPKTRVLCGAGVKTAEDVRKALALGADGVLLASGVVLAKDPGRALEDLLEGVG